MADDDWVNDVRHWVNNGSRSTGLAPADVASPKNLDELGYDAAHPALQAAHWPDAARFAVSGPA